MAQILSDNSVVPSFMGVRFGGRPTDPGDQTNLALRLGEIKELVYPDDPRNQNKRFIEYNVEVQHRDGIGPSSTTIYTGAMIANLFGGVADVFRYTLRPDTKEDVGEDGLGVGSKVLILCMNGLMTRAIILGGVRDTKVDQSTTETKEDGHNLFFEFNGISFKIDKDGQAKLQFRGPTKHDGTLDGAAGASDANGPTTVEIRKDGTLEISTKDGAQFLRMDHGNKKIEILADTEWNVKVNGKGTIQTGSSLEFTVGSTMTVKAQQQISLSSALAGMDISTMGLVTVKSAGVHFGLANEAMVKGTTWITNETAKYAAILPALGAAITGIGTVGAQLTAASTAMKVPVAGAVAANVPIQAAATACAAVASALGAIVTALTTYNTAAPTRLSVFHALD